MNDTSACCTASTLHTVGKTFTGSYMGSYQNKIYIQASKHLQMLGCFLNKTNEQSFNPITPVKSYVCSGADDIACMPVSPRNVDPVRRIQSFTWFADTRQAAKFGHCVLRAQG